MAPNDQYRVNKDTSARKIPTKSDVQANAEREGLLASHAAKETFWADSYEEMRVGYEASIAKINKEYEQTLQEKENQVKRLTEDAEAIRSKAFAEGFAQQQQEDGAKRTSLQKQVEGLTGEKALLTGKLSKAQKTIETFGAKEKALQARINAHPNSWIRISFKCIWGRFKTREYHVKYNSTLTSVLKMLCADIKKPYLHTTCTYACKILDATDATKTLEELGIAEGATIGYVNV